MANNTLDKAIEAIPYFGKRIKLFTEKGVHRTVCRRNHTKTDIFPHNHQITFAAAVQRSGASYRLSGETKPILL